MWSFVPLRWKAGSVALYVVLLTCLLHILWAVLLLTSPAAAGSTPVSYVVTIFGGRFSAAAVLLGAAALALVGLLIRIPGRLMPVMLVPQQFILLLSAGAGVHAGVVGHYADGTPRSWQFIMGDQMPVIILTMAYIAAIITVAVSLRGER